MRKIFSAVSMVVVSSLVGCADSHEAISKVVVASRQDIFQIASSSQTEKGEALLNIDFPVKTYKAYVFGFYIKHSDPAYSIVVNIDGQALELTDEPVLEKMPGHFTDNPDAGTGWRYHFRKSFILKPGAHHISIAVPLSDVFIEKKVVLRSGENTLQLTPGYYTPLARYYRYPWFSKGIEFISIKLNS